MDQIIIGQPRAECARVVDLCGGQDSQVHTLKALLVPIKTAKILCETFCQTIVSVRAVRHLGIDPLGFRIHAHRMNGAGIDHAAQPLARGRFPYIVSANDIGM